MTPGCMLSHLYIHLDALTNFEMIVALDMNIIFQNDTPQIIQTSTSSFCNHLYRRDEVISTECFLPLLGRTLNVAVDQE